ncbi:MAG: GNAT family N-acetyltransferase [Reyranella sp.]|nr:GNAT family N-acetyltransferase [Reyranella sp.]MDP3159957.1 GNAT family N-acetyltransferase [Reyranella sp.]
MLIRAARPDDLPAISALQREAIVTLAEASYGAAATTAWARWQAADALTLLDNGGAFLVGEGPSGLIAVGGWRPDARSPSVAWVRAVFVSPDRARHGAGRRLMAKVEDSASAAGRKDLRLIASVNARLFYEALRYTVSASHQWEIEPGLVLPCLLMEKLLPER